jgi:hypothetical protein
MTTKLAHRVAQLAGTAKKEEVALEKRLNTAVIDGNSKIESGLFEKVTDLRTHSSKQSKESTNSIVLEVSKVSPPILQTIVESHNSLLNRVELLEVKLAEKQTKSQSELLGVLASATKKLEKIEKRKFPVLSLGGVDKKLGQASMEIASVVTTLSARLDQTDASIDAIQASVARKRVFDFDFDRESFSDLLIKVTATERT